MTIEASILVYDDDTVCGRAYASALHQEGYNNVLVASHFEPALTALESEATIDLLLADIVVPGGLNGAALARMARQRQPALKVIFVTGYDIGRSETQAEWPILQKPFSDERLLAEVSRALEAV